MIQKIVISGVFFLALITLYEHHNRVRAEDRVRVLEHNYLSLEHKYDLMTEQKIFLEKELEERNKKTLEADLRVSELEKAKKNSKESCWDVTINPNDPILVRLLKD